MNLHLYFHPISDFIIVHSALIRYLVVGTALRRVHAHLFSPIALTHTCRPFRFIPIINPFNTPTTNTDTDTNKQQIKRITFDVCCQLHFL